MRKIRGKSGRFYKKKTKIDKTGEFFYDFMIRGGDLINFSLDNSLSDLLIKILDYIEKLTQSSLSFYHFVEDGNIIFHEWSTITKKLIRKKYDLKTSGIWLDALREKKYIIKNNIKDINEYDFLFNEKIKVFRELTVPVIKNGKIVAIIGVANKLIDYDGVDISRLKYLADVSWSIVGQKKMQEKSSETNKKLKLKNQQLIESEKQFRELFENMEQGFALHEMIYDEDGVPKDYRFHLVNESFEKLTGLDASNYIGKTIKELIPEIEQIWIDNYGTVSKTSKSMQFEHYSKVFNRYYNVTAYSPKKDFFATIFTDTTNDIIQKDQLKTSDEFLKTVFNAIDDGIIILDTDFNIVSYNDWLLKNSDEKDILGKSCFKSLKKRNSICEICPALDTINTKEVSEEKIESNGKFYKVTTYPIFNDTGDVKYIVEHAKDITNDEIYKNKLLVALDDLKEAKMKAEENDNLKTSFLANMSHEIRTPMNGVLGFAELLRETDLTEEDKEKYIDIIERSGERILAMLEDVLNFAKIEAEQVEVNYEEFNIYKELKHLITFFDNEAKKKNLTILKCEEVDTSLIIKTDKEKLLAIFYNLIKNAIKYTKQGSIHIGCQNHKDKIEFYVEDTGVGIEEQYLDKVFDRFVRVGNTKNIDGGTGLGLAIVKSYIEMIGGTIFVESTYGKGSRFTFTIPLLVK